MASVQGIEKIIEVRSRVKQLEAQLKHLQRSQTELSNFLQEEPGDKDFIQGIEEEITSYPLLSSSLLLFCIYIYIYVYV